MKKLFLILLICFFAYSCKKCAICTQTKTTTINNPYSGPIQGYPQTEVTSFEACGEYLKNVNGQTITSSIEVPGYVGRVVTKTKCQ